jgi:hypothetical protein
VATRLALDARATTYKRVLFSIPILELPPCADTQVSDQGTAGVFGGHY